MIKNNEKKKCKQKIIFYLKILIFLFYLLLLIIKSSHKNCQLENKYLLENDTCHHNYYINKKIEPTEENDGKIFFICGFCGNQYIEAIPKLNGENYIIKQLTNNCKHGKGKRFIYRKKKEIYYEITDNNTFQHSIYGEKCKYCNQNIGEFKFEKIGDIICDGYPRLYQLSKHWNNVWLLGGDNGTILCRRSEDMGKHWSEPVNISNFSNHICTNVDFFELPNHDIICSYRPIGKKIEDPNIKYNRKLFSSISKDGGKTWKDLGLILDNFILANQLGKTKEDAFNACIYESNVGVF